MKSICEWLKDKGKGNKHGEKRASEEKLKKTSS
jgi:hypothetical protein